MQSHLAIILPGCSCWHATKSTKYLKSWIGGQKIWILSKIYFIESAPPPFSVCIKNWCFRLCTLFTTKKNSARFSWLFVKFFNSFLKLHRRRKLSYWAYFYKQWTRVKIGFLPKMTAHAVARAGLEHEVISLPGPEVLQLLLIRPRSYQNSWLNRKIHWVDAPNWKY